MTSDELFSALAAIVGSENVNNWTQAETDRVSVENWPSSPVAIAAPGSPDQAADVVRLAESLNIGVVPAGALNQLYTGYPPNRPTLVVSSRRLNRILDHQPDDLTVTCESGVTLSQVSAALASSRQTLAMDGPLPETSTLGGLVASATAGLRRSAYGAPRDNVIGLKAVITGGNCVKGGGKVVKNVAGYDVCKLFTGCLGALGFLTEITFRVRPVPETTRTVSWALRDTALAARAALAVHHSGIRPAVCANVTEPEQSELVVSFEGSEKRTAWQIEEVSSFLRKLGVDEPLQELGPDAITAVHNKIAIDAARSSIAIRVSVLPADLPQLVSSISKLPINSLVSDASAGTLSAAFSAASISDQSVLRQTIEAALPQESYCIWTKTGTLSEEARPRSALGEDAGGRNLRRSLQKIIDPLRTFSPGRSGL